MLIGLREDLPCLAIADALFALHGRTLADLAPKEFELLLALARRGGSVVSRLDLMREVWGYADSVVTRTIDTHVAELRRKLDDDVSEGRYIITVRKVGYRAASGSAALR